MSVIAVTDRHVVELFSLTFNLSPSDDFSVYLSCPQCDSWLQLFLLQVIASALSFLPPRAKVQASS